MKYLNYEGIKLYAERIIEYSQYNDLLPGLRITNCPNCGAVVKGRKCEYCDTDFTAMYYEMQV